MTQNRWVVPVSSRTILLCALPVIVTMGVLGSLYANGLIGHRILVDLDSLEGDFSVPALWSGLLLLGAAGAAGLAHRVTGDRIILALAVLFAYMAVDEVSEIHEKLESAASVDWQILFLPIMLFAAIAFLVVLRRYWGAKEIWLLMGGGMAWGIAQVLEKLEWGNGDVEADHYISMMVSEETLEMLGSLLFLVSLLALWERLSQPPERPQELTAE